MVAQVSKLSQMNQLLRRGKRKGWAEYGPGHFKALRKMIVDMVGSGAGMVGGWGAQQPQAGGSTPQGDRSGRCAKRLWAAETREEGRGRLSRHRKDHAGAA